MIGHTNQSIITYAPACEVVIEGAFLVFVNAYLLFTPFSPTMPGWMVSNCFYKVPTSQCVSFRNFCLQPKWPKSGYKSHMKIYKFVFLATKYKADKSLLFFLSVSTVEKLQNHCISKFKKFLISLFEEMSPVKQRLLVRQGSNTL
jgi:hypothetical protein